MDVSSWIRTDLDATEARLRGGVERLVPAERWREVVDGGGSTLHHLLLHLTRHHDLAINTVIRDRQPLFVEHRHALGLASQAMAVGVSEAEDRDASATIDHNAVLTYAAATVQATREWLDDIGDLVLDTVPPASDRLERLAGIDPRQYGWLHDMWSAKPVAWFVQWPVVGHTNAHVGEMVSIRNRMGLSPF